MKLGEALKEKGLLTEDRLQLALAHQKVTGDLIGETFVKLGFVSSSEIAKTLAEQAGIPFLDLSEHTVSEEAIRLIPKDIAEKAGFIPLRLIDDDTIEIGVTNPSNITAMDMASKLSRRKTRVLMIDGNAFNKTLESAYYFLENPIQQFIHKAIEELRTSETLPATTAADLSQNLIMEGVRRKATDVHISPTADTVNIFYRVDGVLQHGFCINKSVHNVIVSRIKVLSKLDISEKRLPQDGAFSLTFLETKYDMRVSTTPTIYGENIVIRVLAGTAQLLSIDSLGFDHESIHRLETIFQKPCGIVLISGPTGSGKTTTLYASLREINLIERNVLTVEDPVEYKLSFVKQTSINLKAGYDFALAGRNFMRQDPDVILLGEIRDEETAKIAIRASISGHLVLSTIHSNDAVTSIPRLLDFNIDRFMLSSSLLAVISQRLIRKLCKFCKEEYSVTEDDLRKLGLSGNGSTPRDEPVLTTACRPKGCSMCNETGYTGRTVVGEIMLVNDQIKELISEGASLFKVREEAFRNGMVSLKMSGLDNIRRHVTCVDEVVRVI